MSYMGVGEEGGSRTLTGFHPPDFESGASTDFATTPWRYQRGESNPQAPKDTGT